ncbi:MAG: hypothetical protein IJZ08_08320, partial [Clostridia bacterium]|nr:hypothetical protein [Clostridia bacterium]
MKKLFSLALCALLAVFAVVTSFAAIEIGSTVPTADFSAGTSGGTYNFVDYADSQPELFNNTGRTNSSGAFAPDYSKAGFATDSRGFITLWGGNSTYPVAQVWANSPTYQVPFLAPVDGYYSFGFSVAVTVKTGESPYIPIRVDDGEWYHVKPTKSCAYNAPFTFYGMDSIYLDAGEHVFHFTKDSGAEATYYYYGFTYTYVAHEHTEDITLPAVAPTCTETGLTEGKKCSECGTITVAQETVPTIPHTPGAAATCTEDQVCTVCGALITPADHKFTYTTEAAHPHAVTAKCSVCDLEQFCGYAYVADCADCQKATEISATTPTAPFVDAEAITLNFVDYIDEQPWLYDNTKYWSVRNGPNYGKVGYYPDSRGWITLWGGTNAAQVNALWANRPTYQVKFEAPIDGLYSFAFIVGGTQNGSAYIPVRVDDGDWYHVAFVSAGATTPKTYYGMDNIFLEAGEHVFSFSKVIGNTDTLYYHGFKYTYAEHTHTEETIPAVEATCTTTGLTEGKKCSECGYVTVAQEIVAVLPHTPGDAATCTTDQVCTVCGTVLNIADHNFAYSVDDAHPHAVNATCNACGLEKFCGYAYVADCEDCQVATEISATTPSAPFVDAEAVTLNFVDYVDEQPWLYNNTRFWAVKGSPYWNVAGFQPDSRGYMTLWGKDEVQVNRPTYQVTFEAPENGFYSFAFTVGGTLKDAGSYIPVRVDAGDWYHIMYSTSAYNNPKTYYGMDNIYLEAGEHVFSFAKAVGTEETQYYWGFQYTYEAHTHTEVILPAVEATCTTTGLTEGKMCSDCGNIIVEQEIVPFKHVPGAEATCTEDQTCTLCGEVIVEALGHTYAAGTRTDETHPHAIYNVCVCGEEQATGEYAELDSCPICNPIATKPEGTVNYGTPVIDGEMDDIYADTLTIVYDGNLDMNAFKDLGWADAKATVYAMYDEQYVYFYAVVEDDDVYMADASYYEKYNPFGIDAIEFRLNFGGEANQANQFKITLDAYGVQAFNLWADRYPYTKLDTYATALTETGYVLELAVPHTVEGTDNTNLLEVGKLGFNMWLVDLYTLGSTAPVHGTDYYMYGLNYGNGNGVAEYYDLGAKEEEPEIEKFAMSGASMTLGNELSLSFFFPVAKIPADEECYVVVTKEYADGRADVIRTFTPDTWQKLGSTLYYVSFNGIAAKEMADKMYVQVFNS